MALTAEQRYAQQMAAYQNPYARSGYGYGRGANKFEMNLIQTPNINRYAMPVDEMANTATYRQERHDAAVDKFDEIKLLQSTYRVSPKHRQYLDDANAKLDESLDAIVKSGDYGSNTNNLRTSIGDYIGDSNLQEAVKANQTRLSQFKAWDAKAADGSYKATDVKKLKEDYNKSMPDLTTTDGLPDPYTYNGRNLVDWKDWSADIQTAWKTYVTEKGTTGGLEVDMEALDKDNTEAGILLKQMIKHTEYKTKKDAYDDVYKYLMNHPEISRMFGEREELGTGDNQEEWARGLAEGVSGYAEYENTKAQGSASIVGAKGAGGGGLGGLGVEGSVESEADAITTRSESGVDEAAYYDYVTGKGNEMTDLYTEILTGEGKAVATTNSLKKKHSESRKALMIMDSKLKAEDDLVDQYDKIIDNEDSTEDEIKAATASKKQLEKKTYKIGKRTVGRALYVEHRNKLAKANDDLEAAEARMDKASNDFAIEHGYYKTGNDADPFNPINKKEMAVDVSASAKTVIENGSSDIYKELGNKTLIESKQSADDARRAYDEVYGADGLTKSTWADDDDVEALFNSTAQHQINVAKHLVNGTEEDKIEFTTRYKNGAYLFNTLDVGALDNIDYSMVSAMTKLDNASYDDVMLYLATTYEDAGYPAISLDTKTGGMLESFSNSLSAVSSNLENSNTLTTTGRITTSPNANPGESIVPKALLNFNKKQKDEIATKAKLWTHAYLASDIVLRKLGSDVKALEDVDLTGGYNAINGSNGVTQATLAKHNLEVGTKLNEYSVVYLPGYDGKRYISTPVYETTAADGANDKFTSLVGHIYAPTGSHGITTASLNATENDPANKAYGWYVQAAAKSGNATAYNIRHVFNLEKMGYVDGIMNLATGVTYFKDKNGKTIEQSTASVWGDLVDNFKLYK